MICAGLCSLEEARPSVLSWEPTWCCSQRTTFADPEVFIPRVTHQFKILDGKRYDFLL